MTKIVRSLVVVAILTLAACSNPAPPAEKPAADSGDATLKKALSAYVVEFLRRKWNKELDYRLKKELWAFAGNRIAVRFEYEWHDDSGQWYRSYGNENWEFDELGYMKQRFASINDLPIKEADRKFRWERKNPPSK